jgi:hypothetical protein
MAETKKHYVKVVRDGYTYMRQGHPKGSVMEVSETQLAASKEIQPPYLEEITKADFEKSTGQVEPVALDPEGSSLAPAAAEEERRAREETASAAKAGSKPPKD